jgi:hypothetical protein
MGYAQVLTTAFVAGATGGTFADSLAAGTGDSVAVANYAQGGARILEAWANDNAHVAEGEMIYTRPEATHDQQHGWRFSIQAAAFNAVGHVGEVSLLSGKQVLNVFKSDTPQLLVSSTASDNVAMSWLTEYDDLPGAAAAFISPADVIAHHKSKVGIRVSATANGSTAGQYGAQRAFNADDDRLHANTWYAIEGINVQLPVLTVSLIGPDFGGQRIGLPAGSIEIRSSSFFMDQSVKWGKKLVPVFNSNNKANTLVQVVDTATSTSPQIDFQLIELDYPSTWSPVGGGAY